MVLSERKKKILRAVIEDYIENAEPVGSRTVLRETDLDCSPATIRSELAALTRDGYLEQPHTSAGRVPTARGYRLYVNELMRERKLSAADRERINDAFTDKTGSWGDLTSRLTSYPAVSITKPDASTVRRFGLICVEHSSFIIVLLLNSGVVATKVVNLPYSFDRAVLQRLSAVFNAAFTGITSSEMSPVLISSTQRAAGDTLGLTSIVAQFTIETLESGAGAEAVVSGEAELLKLPEFHDPDKAHRLISYLSDARHFEDLDSSGGDGDVRVFIGPENAAEELRDTSVIMASYDAGDSTRGLIGVVGPTRMDYSAVAAKLSYIASTLSRLMRSGGSPPEGFGKLMIKGDDSDG